MSSTDGARRVRMDSAERRRQILHAATGLFLHRPYSQVSISDIAEAAGVARGLLHHYFDSKRDLYLEVVRSIAQVPLAVDDGAAGGDGDEPWGRGIDALLGFVADNRELWLNAVTVGGAEGDEEVASIIDDSREVLAERTIDLLGLDAEDTPALRAVLRGYGGLVQEITLEWLERGRLTQAQAREVLVRTLPLLLQHVLPALRDGSPQQEPSRGRHGARGPRGDQPVRPSGP
ncbi:MAG TPA: TetR/AcrR family transcriptional regulator [Acidimicrobiales bacterium]|nr:TetR/AcrR family transcriptional regulator [Acidimicrobiales bacterium]